MHQDVSSLHMDLFLRLPILRQENVFDSIGVQVVDRPALPMSMARFQSFVHHVINPNKLADKFMVELEVQYLKTCAEEHRKEMQ